MNKRYVCIKPLELQLFDDDGFEIENEWKTIEIGEIWEAVHVPYNIVAGKDAVHLEKELSWCELLPDTLEEYFEECKESTQ